MGNKTNQGARKKRGNRETAGAKLRALSAQHGQDALKNVGAWEKNCRWRMEEAAKRRTNSTEVVVHSAEVRTYPGTNETFTMEFRTAAEALKKRLQRDGSVKAPYRFLQTRDTTIFGGYGAGGREDKRDYPAAHRLIFSISW